MGVRAPSTTLPICTVAQAPVPCQENTEPEAEVSYNGAAGDPSDHEQAENKLPAPPAGVSWAPTEKVVAVSSRPHGQPYCIHTIPSRDVFPIGCELRTSSVMLKALHRRCAEAVPRFSGTETQLPRSGSSKAAAGGEWWASNEGRNTAEDAPPI